MQKTIYSTVFISGLCSLAVEMAASRLLGNVFGTSNLVWASIIGLILIYLAGGYYIGGYWADRSPNFRTFYLILLGSGIATTLVPVASRPVLRLAANAFDQLQMGVLFGSFTSVMVLLAIPTILLGMASPFAIRLALKNAQTAGSVSGRIYAVSTLGSFIGTFLPVLVLIPTIGTYRTFISIGGVLVLLALIGLWITGNRRLALAFIWTPLVVLAILLWGLPGSDKTSKDQIYETESGYNYIQVLQKGEYRFLRLNEGQGIHSIYHPTEMFYGGPWEMVLAAPLFNPAPVDPHNIQSMAIVGLAAGTTARQASAVFDQIAIDGIEIDPIIVRVGKEFFDMNQPSLNVIIQDGRWGLSNSTNTYQIISIDAYRPPYIPWHLTTREFFQIVHQHLTDDGVLVINVGRAPNDRRLIDALGSTISSVFSSVYVVDIPNTFNSILYATIQPTHADNLVANYALLQDDPDTHPLLLAAAAIAITNQQPLPKGDIVFTDDVAPVEWITNNMVLRFILSPQLENLQ